MAEFRNVIKPSEKKPLFEMEEGNRVNPLAFIKDGFRLETILAVGAVVQGVLILTLPIRIALAPAVFYLLLRITAILLESNKVLPASYQEGVVTGKVSAQLPDPSTGRFGSSPAARNIVVFSLAVRFNHALGIWSPGGQEIVEHFTKMNKYLMEESEKYGLLSVSNWMGTDRKDTNTVMLMYYFRDLDSVNRFAHDPVHRAGWDWYNKSKHQHIGIMHEAYSISPGSYESIYVNMPPTLMGASTMKVKNEETGHEEWLRPLVAADRGVLRSQFGRMQKSAGQEHEGYGAEPVWHA